MICEWCGHEHARQALCSQRPKWSRRGFLALMGAAAVGLYASPFVAVPSVNPRRLSTFSMLYDNVDRDMYVLLAKQLTEMPDIWKQDDPWLTA